MRLAQHKFCSAAAAAVILIAVFQTCHFVRAGISDTICDSRGLVRWVDEYVESFLYNASFVEGSMLSSGLMEKDRPLVLSPGRTNVSQQSSFYTCNKVRFEEYGGRKEDLNKTLESAILSGLLDNPLSRHFLFFLGYGHSGHSIFGAILDAHPEMLVANELHALKKYYCTKAKKNQLFVQDEAGHSEIKYVASPSIKNSLLALLQPQSPADIAMLVDFYIVLNTAVCSQIGRVQHHDYSISGQYQGSWSSVDTVKFFGDKKGGSSTEFLQELACLSCPESGNMLINEMEFFKNTRKKSAIYNSNSLISQIFDRESASIRYYDIVRFTNQSHDLSKFSILKDYLTGSCFLSCSRARAKVEEFLNEYATIHKPPLYVMHVLPHFQLFLKEFFSKNQRWRNLFILNMEVIRMMRRMPEKYRVLAMASTSLRYNSTQVILKLCEFFSVDCAEDFVQAASKIVIPLGRDIHSEKLSGRSGRSLSETDSLAFHELLVMYPELKAIFADDIMYQHTQHLRTS